VIAADWLTGLAAVTALLWIFDLLYIRRGVRQIASLEDLSPAADEDCPRASVCVAARNEEDDVEEAVASFLALDYPEIEVVAVDDRSTDATGRILERLADRDERLTVRHVNDLPDGWLGKNHALHLAAREASGDVLVFTDADVTFEPSSLRRAVGHMQLTGLDHLTTPPGQAWPTSLLRTVGTVLQWVLLHRIRPWRIGAEESDVHAGVGAFNLVRRSAYETAGGHEAIATRPVDDMALAERLQATGARSSFLFGRGLVRVRWYGDVTGFVRGMGRSMVADFDYSLLPAAAAALLLVFLHTWPWAGALLIEGPGRWLSVIPVAGSIALSRMLPKSEGAAPRDVLWWPVAGLVLAWTALRAAVLARWRGGITWRGTFYPLEELRG